ncbi:MAG: hypothetical protein CM15mP13_1470 [Pseudomonadota bacterium]|nr:MAG: hypothetical protein CM15mP13_1470 [Pseudomonadota bacterium]
MKRTKNNIIKIRAGKNFIPFLQCNLSFEFFFKWAELRFSANKRSNIFENSMFNNDYLADIC